MSHFLHWFLFHHFNWLDNILPNWLWDYCHEPNEETLRALSEYNKDEMIPWDDAKKIL